MDDKDIKLIREILKIKNREDIASKLEGAYSEISETGQYGSYMYSIISNFLIFAPLTKFYELKKLSDKDKQIILDAVLEIHPPDAYEPEIVSIDFRILRLDESSGGITDESIDEKKLEIFLSYSSKDKNIAGEFKEKLQRYGIKVFLAHEDIEPTEEWEKIILEHLDICSIFIPIISENFKLSDWTSQEIGIAIGKNKFIIPVALDNKIPYGFIKKFQAISINGSRIDEVISKIISIIKTNVNFKELLSESVLKIFLDSNSYNVAEQRSSFLKEFDFTPEQINKIIKGSIDNSQIYDCYIARKRLRIFMDKYNEIIDPTLQKELLKKIR